MSIPTSSTRSTENNRKRGDPASAEIKGCFVLSVEPWNPNSLYSFITVTNGVIFEDNLEQRFPLIAINASWLVSFMRILLGGARLMSGNLETAHEGIVIRMSHNQHNKRNGLVLMNYEAPGVEIKNRSPMHWQLKSKITHRRLNECDVNG